MMTFEITDNQHKQYMDWITRHKCDAYAGACGGKISWTFTRTGLGLCVVVKCICGEEINITDTDVW